MGNQNVYQIRGELKNHEEAKEFMEWYRASVRRSFDRHMVVPKHVPMHSYVLDYGCGWGTFSEILHEERACRVDGIDVSSNAIALAKDFIGERQGLSFSTTPIQGIESGSYDVVVSTEVIEHTHNPGVYLRECNRVLRPEGYLVISLPNIMTPRYILSTLLGNARRRFVSTSEEFRDGYDKTRHHIHSWDPATFCRLICTVGFEYVRHEFMEGQAWPKNVYWRHPWGRLRNLSCKIVFKLQKRRYTDIQPHE